MTESTSLPRAVSEARRFSRFYISFVDGLSDRMLKSSFTLPQARVMHEIATGPKGAQAADIARELRMDAGQMSRVVKGLERQGLIRRAPLEGQAKRLRIELTEAGQAAFDELEQRAADLMGGALGKLTGEDRTRVIRAMRLITRLLGQRPHPAVPVALRAPEPGDLGWVVSRQSVLYAAEYGWTGEYEALALRILSGFAAGQDPARERAWIAEIDGERLGAVFLLRKDDATAQLRLLHVEHAARGMGIGRQLVEAAIGFARAAGYGRVELWTNDVLRPARRLYVRAGFELVGEERHHSFGQDLTGQVWARDL